MKVRRVSLVGMTHGEVRPGMVMVVVCVAVSGVLRMHLQHAVVIVVVKVVRRIEVLPHHSMA